MPEPNPIWGLHLTAGSISAVCLRRAEDGSLDVEARHTELAPEGGRDLVRDALPFLDRRGVRGRAAFIALPDTDGTLVTAHVPPEDADLGEHDMRRELADHTPFEIEDCVLCQHEVAGRGRGRSFVVGALPGRRFQEYVDILGEGDFGLYGLGLAGAAVLRGARNLGLVYGETFLLDVQPRVSFVLAVDGDDVRRYPIAYGSDDVLAAALAEGHSERTVLAAMAGRDDPREPAVHEALRRAALPLTDDVRTTVAYHREQHRRQSPEDAPEFRIVPVGSAARAPGMLAALGAALGEELDTSPGAPTSPLRPATSAGLDAAWCGALGAALEAFADGVDRLALRAPPDDVPEFAESSNRRTLLLAVLLAAVAVLAFFVLPDKDNPPAGPGETRVATQAQKGPENGAPAAAEWTASTPLDARLGLLEQRTAVARALAATARLIAAAGDDAEGRSLMLENVPDGVRVRLTLALDETIDAAGLAARATSPARATGVTATRDGAGLALVEFRVPFESLPRHSAAAQEDGVELLAELDGALGLIPGEDLLRDVLSSAARSAPEESTEGGSRRIRFSVSGDRVWLVLRSVATCAGNDTVSGMVVEPAGDGFDLVVTARRLKSAPDLVTTPSLGTDLVGPLRAALAQLSAASDESHPSGPFRFAVESVADDTVRLRVRKGPGGCPALVVPEVSRARAVERAEARDSVPPEERAWARVALAPRPDGGELVDDTVPGPGRYAWRLAAQDGLPAGPEVQAAVQPDVTVAVAPGANSGATAGATSGGAMRFVVSRRFAGRESALESAEVAPGSEITATAELPGGAAVTIRTGHVFVGTEREDATEEGTEPVAEFRPDGKIAREADGAPRVGERVVRRVVTRTVLRLRTPSGEVRSVLLEK